MKKWIKTAIILLVAGVLLFMAGSLLGGRGISINRNFKVITADDYKHFSYVNMDMEEFNAVDIEMKNAAVTFLPSENGGYGVEVSYRIVDEDDIRVEVKNQKLIVETKEKMFWMSWDFSFFADDEIKEYVTVYLPRGEYEDIIADTSNSVIEMEVSDVSVKELELVTSNAGIRLSGAECGELTLNTSNASVMLEKVTSPVMKVKTSNGSIEILDSCINDLAADTSNASITMRGIALSSEKGEISLDTSNGKIRVDLQDYGENEFKINADTSNADIYINERKLEKNDYVTKEGTVRLELDTSNGDIVMNFK